jgi:23S rRNA (guanine2445-N2)-methyltransferase / 23S rRNA (guanine2069-N7)-methyltransferase
MRKRQKGLAQYERLSTQQHFHEIQENGLRLLVNFSDYLDTGLFLDHRITRSLVGKNAQGKDFLNLFAYTGTATVHAAQGGARSTTTVDMSNTYLDWAQRNMALNGYRGAEHKYIQADCLQWLRDASKQKPRYGLIFLDPPSFSTSKRMTSTFDVQRDHVKLLEDTLKLLTVDGTLIFSNNLRKFKLDKDALTGCAIEDISAKTLPKDFAGNPRIHQCFILKKR